MLGFFLDGEILGESFLFLAILLGDHDALQVLGVDHPAVDLELAEGVVNLVGGELLTPGHQRVPEPVEEEISVLGVMQIRSNQVIRECLNLCEKEISACGGEKCLDFLQIQL